MVVLPNGMKAVVAGLDNFLVAQKEGMLMICPNTNSDLIRKLINEAYQKAKKAGRKPQQQPSEPIRNSTAWDSGCLNCNFWREKKVKKM